MSRRTPLTHPDGGRPLTPPPVEGRLGDYHILSKIAEGGMGAIFLAKKVGVGGFEKTFVIKVMLESLASSDEFVAMFFDEARLAARLAHPNVAQIYDFGVIDGHYYIAMEHIPGEDLSAIVGKLRKRQAKIPVAIALRIMIDVCAGLEYAHTLSEGGRPLRIIHRDISPSNVMVSYQGAVKLLDFGIARAASRVSATRSGGVKGKLPFLAPEQIKGQEIDARADLFSLGITFYALLTGRHPFRRDNELATVHAIAHEDTPDPRGDRSGLSDAVVAILQRSLARAPDDRYPSAGEMGADLQAALVQAAPGTGAAELTSFMIALFGRAAMEERSQIPNLAQVNLAELLTSRGDLAAVPEPTPLREPAGQPALADGDEGATRPRPLDPPTTPDRPAGELVPPPPAPPRRLGPALGALVGLAACVSLVLALSARGPRQAPAPPRPAPAAPVITPLPRPPAPAPPPEPPAAPAPRVRARASGPPPGSVGAPFLPGRLDRKTLQAVVEKAHPRLADCFKRHTDALPGATGQVAVELVVAGSGRVSSAHAALTGPGTAPLAACLEQVAARLRFPGHSDREVHFAFPLAYRKGGN